MMLLAEVKVMPTEYPNWFKQSAIENFKEQLTGFADKPGLRFLQIGVFTGDASVWLMENILTQKDSVLEDVDTWAGSDEAEHNDMDFSDVEKTYDEKVASYKNIIKYKTDSTSYLKSLEVPTFDFIYIDGDHTAEGVLRDAVLSWRLLNPGGIIAFDDYTWTDPRGIAYQPKWSIDTFVTIVKEDSEILTVNTQVWLKKKE